MDHKREAQRVLEKLRKATDNYGHWVRVLRAELKKGDLLPSDIGTTEEELQEYWVKDCKIAIQQVLEKLRKGTSIYEFYLKLLRLGLEQGGLSLSDVGTSEEELEALRVKGCKIAARGALKNLRSGTDDYRFNLNRLRRELEKGGLVLSDIGTTEEELARLAERKA